MNTNKIASEIRQSLKEVERDRAKLVKALSALDGRTTSGKRRGRPKGSKNKAPVEPGQEQAETLSVPIPQQ
jgi:hypothetical protein